MRQLVILLEEPSARDLLEGLLPRLVPADVRVFYMIFEGKQDLERNIAKKLRGWQQADALFVILRDQDAADCHQVKQRLVNLVQQSGRQALVRVACKELESWIVGDWLAVAAAFNQAGLAKQLNKSGYSNPDLLVRPVETLRKHLPAYQKRDGARRVGPHLDLERNKSKSFRVFCSGVLGLLNRSKQA
jgi:Domain of unknown function (DUF4276)